MAYLFGIVAACLFVVFAGVLIGIFGVIVGLSIWLLSGLAITLAVRALLRHIGDEADLFTPH